MQKVLLMGNEAIARGAIEAGVMVATAYPGTPSTEVFSTLADLAPEYGFYAEWSVNEKVALEVAAGAAYTGARAMVSMKQMGLNVASDALMSLAYIGVKGGLVLVVADDPGPQSSQTEQDTRKFAAFAGVPVFDPATPQEAKDMVQAAFELSEKFGLPVILRPTTRVSHVSQDITLGDVKKLERSCHFQRDPRWVILPKLAYKQHIWLDRVQAEVAEEFNDSPFNRLSLKGKAGIVTSGVAYNYVLEACQELKLEPSLLKIGTPYPLPPKPALEMLASCGQVLVIEEQEAVVEDQLIKLAWQNRLGTAISGKHDSYVPREGELSVDKVKTVLISYFNLPRDDMPEMDVAPLPLRAPGLCAGCPHRASFLAFKELMRRDDVVFTGDIGCYTLGAEPPLEMLDTCLCMGAGITLAVGMSKIEPERKHVAFIGDSTFFHSGVPGLIDAVYNNANIVVVVLDNGTTAMTGHQPHPGTARTATGVNGAVLDPGEIARSCGVKFVREVDPYLVSEMKTCAREALEFDGPRFIVARRACVLQADSLRAYSIDAELCTGCELCIKKLGCPAIVKNQVVQISAACAGCGVCARICPSQAICEVV